MPCGLDIDSVWTRQLLDELAADGHDVMALAAELDRSARRFSAGRERVPLTVSAMLFERAAALTGNDLIGLDLGRTRDARDAGLIAYVGMASPRLEDSLYNFAAYQKVHGSAGRIDVSRLRAFREMAFGYRLPEGVVADQQTEAAAATIMVAIRAFTGVPVQLAALSFHHRRTANTEAFESFFGCPVRFGEPRQVMRFRPEDLARPLRTADDRLLVILVDLCRRVLEESPAAEGKLVDEVERRIAETLPMQRATADVVAERLGMSSRTLARRLAEEGTSFAELLDRLRRALATCYLGRSELSVTDVAYLLGYAQPSSFSSAFRRWTGSSPSAYRRRHTAEAAE